MKFFVGSRPCKKPPPPGGKRKQSRGTETKQKTEVQIRINPEKSSVAGRRKEETLLRIARADGNQ